jgi:hypothetical protein
MKAEGIEPPIFGLGIRRVAIAPRLRIYIYIYIDYQTRNQICCACTKYLKGEGIIEVPIALCLLVYIDYQKRSPMRGSNPRLAG